MEKKVGIYVHIPFCKSKCAYCNFYSLSAFKGGDKLIPDYQTAVIKHIEEYEAQLDGYLIDTVYSAEVLRVIMARPNSSTYSMH